MRAFTAISRALNLGQPLSETLDLIAEKVSQTMGHKYCAVLLADGDTESLYIRGAFGLGEEYVRKLNTELLQKTAGEGPMSRSVTAQAFRTRMPVYAPDITADPRFALWREAALEAGYRSIVALPLIFREEVIGVLNCYDEPRQYTEDQVEAMTVVAEQAASAAGIARLMEEQRATIEDLNSLNEHLSAQHERLRRSERAHETLTSLLLGDCSLDDITVSLYELLQAPVLLQDEEFGVLSSAGADDEMFSDLPVLRDAIISCVQSPLNALKRTGRAQTVEAFAPAPGVREESQTLLVTAVDLGNGEFGFLSAPSADKDSREFALRTLEQASTVCALYMARRRAAREAEDRLRGNLLADLLSGRLEDRETLRERARHLGLDLSRSSFRVFVARHEPLRGYLARNGQEPDILDRSSARLLALAREFATDIAAGGTTGAAMLEADGEHMVLLAPASEDREPSATAERLVHAIRSRFTDLDLRVAVSARCARPEDLVARNEETRSLLDLTDRLGVPDRVVCYDDWKLHGLLLRGGDRRDFSEIAHRHLDPLIRHDRQNNGVLLPTLEAYLRNDLSPSRTAESLFVHLNTVKYRLGRISELVGADLGNLEIVLTIKVALMVRGIDPESFDAEISRKNHTNEDRHAE